MIHDPDPENFWRSSNWVKARNCCLLWRHSERGERWKNGFLYRKDNYRTLPPRRNLVGMKFGRLTVMRFLYGNARGRNYWLCKCQCGQEKKVQQNNLGRSANSCGCSRQGENSRRFINLVGQSSGKLRVIKLQGFKSHRTYWVCECDCGKYVTVDGCHLKNGHTKSCGSVLHRSGSAAAIYKDGLWKERASYKQFCKWNNLIPTQERFSIWLEKQEAVKQIRTLVQNLC